MSEITAAKVKAFRERTGLPLMDCKQALTEAGGDEQKAYELLRMRGEKLGDKRADRETAFGRFGIYAGHDKQAGAIVELKCESAPVTQNEEFIQLVNNMAELWPKPVATSQRPMNFWLCLHRAIRRSRWVSRRLNCSIAFARSSMWAAWLD